MSPETDARTRLGFGLVSRRQWLFRRFSQLLRSLLLVYLVVLLVLMLFENYLIFPARTFPRGNWTPSGISYEDVYFASADGTRLHGWLVQHPDPALHILICHGNAEHVADLADLIGKYHQQYRATVFAFDYRGYGRSEGRPNERGVLSDGHAAQAWLARRAGIPASQLVIIGRSLGGAVAVQLAASSGARGLVLERTFSSLPEVAARHFPWLPVRWLMKSRFDSAAKITAFRGSLLQTHGTSDEVVPYELGKRLFELAASDDKTFIAVPGGTHNEPHSLEYWRALDAFLGRLSSPRVPQGESNSCS